MNNLRSFALIVSALLETNYNLTPTLVDLQLTRDTHWSDSWLDLDSLDLVVLQMALEKQLKIRLPENIYEICPTVGQLQDYILEAIE